MDTDEEDSEGLSDNDSNPKGNLKKRSRIEIEYEDIDVVAQPPLQL